MSLTLNQIIKRIRDISLAHKQLRNFYFGFPSDFLTDKITRYASAFLQDVPGVLDIVAKTDSLSFKLYLLDLVHVSDDTGSNELDVQSDMRSIAKDIVAEMNHSSYTDWKISAANPVTLLREEFDDMVAGVVVEITISSPWDVGICDVPTDSIPGVVTIEVEKDVFDTVYTSNGTEGNSLNIPEIVGKKILLLIRENSPIYKVSSLPESSEYVWNDILIELGTDVNPDGGERFLILYRNY